MGNGGGQRNSGYGGGGQRNSGYGGGGGYGGIIVAARTLADVMFVAVMTTMVEDNATAVTVEDTAVVDTEEVVVATLEEPGKTKKTLTTDCPRTYSTRPVAVLAYLFCLYCDST